MRLASLLLLIALFVGRCFAEKAEIITREGDVMEVEITQYNPVGIKYMLRKAEYSLPYTDIYMIYTKSQGNRYVNSEGQLNSGEGTKASTANDVVYLVNGGEKAVVIKSVLPNEIVFQLTPEDKKALENTAKQMQKGKIPREERVIAAAEQADDDKVFLRDHVFMIIHKGGVTEIITPLPPVGSEAQAEQSQTAPKEEAEPILELKYHRVEKGQTLDTISQMYDVTPADIIEWNDLPQSTKASAQLPIGTQLIIYVAVE